MSKWDLDRFDEWKAEEFPRGAAIPEAGNSNDYVTGGWRSERPDRDDEVCTQCLLCWIFCPDTAVIVEDEKVVDFDWDHCKGCGVCANECPSNAKFGRSAITMTPEPCELKGVEETLEQTTVATTGNSLVAEAFRQCAPDVVAAYPITPQTTIVEEFAKIVAQGRVHTEYVTVESEHSALSACIGSSAAGARVMTATSSQGLALMWEELFIASGMRLPIIMANANRALSAPINIHCDHSDVMGARDAGWIMLFAETAQEAYDNTLMCVRISEHPDVLLPSITALDGFITTHSIDRAEVMDDAAVAEFVGNYEPTLALLDEENPVSHGNFAGLGGPYFEFKRAQRNAMDRSAAVIRDVGDEFSKLSGCPFGMIEGWGMEDAEVAIVVIGSTAGNARHVARELRAEGVKAGVLKVRCFRPFPAAEIREALKDCKAVAVLDRSESFGAEGGPLYLETRSALYDLGCRVPMANYIYGLGGSDVTLDLMRRVYTDLNDIASGSAVPESLVYLGAR